MTRKNTYSELLDNGYVVGSLSCDTVALISGCDLGSYFSGKEMCLTTTYFRCLTSNCSN